MPTNLYGEGDTYDLFSSHVVPAMIRKFHEAKKSRDPVVLWGEGSPYREFLYADDCADALVFLMEQCDYSNIGEIINVGSGFEETIRELATLIASVVGYKGKIEWDISKPNGTPRKLLDSSKLFSYGWRPSVGLREGIERTYSDFLNRKKEII